MNLSGIPTTDRERAYTSSRSRISSCSSNLSFRRENLRKNNEVVVLVSSQTRLRIQELRKDPEFAENENSARKDRLVNIFSVKLFQVS